MRRHLRPCVLVALLLVVTLGTPVLRAGEDAAPLARVKVKEEGFCRVSAASLAGLGVASAADVEVRLGGRRVPVSRAGEGGDLVFLAQGHATEHSTWGVYEILRRGTDPRPPLAPQGGERKAATALARRVRAPDHVYGALAAGRPEAYDHPGAPTWFVTFIRPGGESVVDLDPLGALEGSSQTLEATVWANRIGEVALRAVWGGHDLGVARGPTAAGGAVFRWLVPHDAVPAEGTALRLVDESPPPPPPPPQDVTDGRGTLFVDALALSGPVEPVVDARLRVFDLAPDERLELEIRGELRLPGPDAFLVIVGPDGTTPAARLEGMWTQTTDGRRHLFVTAPKTPGCRLFASTAAREVEPTPAAPADPLTRAGDARHVILAVPALLEPSQALARHRLSQGLASAVVPVQEVYDAFGHGAATPEAIRAFLVALMRRPNAPLDYVLLAGDATMNRTDYLDEPTIPTPMARTIYNGATSADRLYALPADGSQVGGPAIGRLPFRDAATMKAYVDRVIAYETKPPADPTRRLLRFVTNEARFGPIIDRLIEGAFRGVVSAYIPPAYDLEITYASPTSPYLWPPPEFDDKVVDAFDEGCLFLTYVGHGFAEGFDSLHVGDKRFPVLYKDAAERVTCRGTPPAVFVIACTTAIFDRPAGVGVGEALLARPQGPVAYWGATRICHPAANTLYGRSIARFMSAEDGRWRLGDILARARDDVLQPAGDDFQRKAIDFALRGLAQGASPERLALEGTWMYSLLGDPALRIAVPASDVSVEATIATTKDRPLEAVIQAPLPDGTVLHLSLEVTRTRTAHDPVPVTDPLDPASFETIRENHARVNDLALVRHDVVLAGGRATWSLPSLPDTDAPRLVVKAWTIANGDVHQGAAVLEVPEAPGKDAGD